MLLLCRKHFTALWEQFCRSCSLLQPVSVFIGQYHWTRKLSVSFQRCVRLSGAVRSWSQESLPHPVWKSFKGRACEAFIKFCYFGKQSDSAEGYVMNCSLLDLMKTLLLNSAGLNSRTSTGSSGQGIIISLRITTSAYSVVHFMIRLLASKPGTRDACQTSYKYVSVR